MLVVNSLICNMPALHTLSGHVLRSPFAFDDDDNAESERNSPVARLVARPAAAGVCLSIDSLDYVTNYLGSTSITFEEGRKEGTSC